ncbi:MerR family transcriptional regulator [Pseudoalteromonas luteoviolacea]|uniref:MerR family transcriptional regulator n=1 Tax=Pseudoalteromonas luteoviolacea TaxID=43657 RepID=A0A1C0TSD2_9GAMM|nr:helix-turn-helix domain-containing protein [Pseudoalteromonas luteoviolacea]MBQ4810809.1 helix-turn-helix domain-containing protein [Pseudoalteromonas luteoviolacea]OCQ22150.1 MerR family transcriptional regulator [Pseudoalteromonas luteoviolacea]
MLDIGKVTKMTGINASALRYYESKGLIQPAGRNGIRRYYSEDVIEQLSIIALGQLAGFSLDEIATIFTKDGVNISREKLIKKSHEIETKIKQLQAIQNGLKKAANCPHSNHLDCNNFRRLMKVAINGNS